VLKGDKVLASSLFKGDKVLVLSLLERDKVLTLLLLKGEVLVKGRGVLASSLLLKVKEG
jgi:hypothetical protein